MGTESKATLSNGFSVSQPLSTGNQESYQGVVLSFSGGVVVVVLVVVVAVEVVLTLARCRRSLRKRIIRRRLSLSAL